MPLNQILYKGRNFFLRGHHHHSLLTSSSLSLSATNTMMSRRTFITTTTFMNQLQQPEKSSSPRSRGRQPMEKDKLKQRQLNFEKRLKELDETATTSINPTKTCTTQQQESSPKSFEQRLKELEQTTNKSLKPKVPKWLKEHHTRLPTPYSIYVKQCWKQAIEEYEKNKQHFDNLYPNVQTRHNLMISKILALRWRSMSEEDKAIYYSTHREMKLSNPLPIVDNDKPEWKKIKRPRTAFLHFKMDIFKSVKTQFSTYNIQQLNFIISEMYKKLPEDQLEYYRGLCSKERSQYYKLKEESLNKNKKQPVVVEEDKEVTLEEGEEEEDEYESDDFY